MNLLLSALCLGPFSKLCVKFSCDVVMSQRAENWFPHLTTGVFTLFFNHVVVLTGRQF